MIVLFKEFLLGLCCLEVAVEGIFRATTTEASLSGICVDSCEKHGKCETRSNFNREFDSFLRVLMAGSKKNPTDVGIYKDGKVCSCDPGYRGPTCSEKCTSGHGPYCLESCPPGCAGRCDPQTGSCKTGSCKNGSNADHCIIQIEDDVPTVEIIPDKLRVFAGDSVEFVCKTTGIPDPTVVWTRLDRKRENPTASFKKGKFIVPRALASDAGVYKCRATNSAGTAHATAVLKVREFRRANSPPNDAEMDSGTQNEIPDASCKGPDCIPGANKVECAKNDREIAASFAVGSQNEEEMTRLQSDSNRLQFFEDEMGIQFDGMAIQRASNMQRVAAAFIGAAAYCGTTATAVLKLGTSRHSGSSEEESQNERRVIRQADSQIQMRIASSFPSSSAEGLHVRSIYGRFIKDFSDDFESEVLPGAKIRKDSIAVSQVMVTRNTTPATDNSTSQKYLLFGGLSLMGLLIASAVVLYSLKKKKRSRTRRTVNVPFHLKHSSRYVHSQY